MAILIVDNDSFDQELGKLNGNKTDAKVVDIARGRGNGNKEVPESLRKIIGENALIETHKDTARAFGISPSSVAAYKNGSTSTASYNEPDSELSKAMMSSKDRISGRARKKLLMALSHITEEKLTDAKLGVISGVARDMSSIIRNIEPPAANVTENNVKFVFFSPKQKDETEYEVINALE